jgi:gluconate 2-dehydrogenase gamma chain
MSMTDLARRTVIKATGVLGAAMVPVGRAPDAAAAAAHMPSDTQAAAKATPQTTTYLFFNTEEAAFIEAAVARLIPADPQWPSGAEAGVPK